MFCLIFVWKWGLVVVKKLYKLALAYDVMVYLLKFGKKFDREFEKIDKSISSQIVKKLARLKENPEIIGKPLLYTNPSLWEFKAEVFRIFYIVQENRKEVWLLSVKHKDECDNYIRRGYSKDLDNFGN